MSAEPTGLVSCNLCGADEPELLYAKDGYALARCRKCGLAYQPTPPSPAELHRLYSFQSGYHVAFRDDAGAIRSRRRIARRHLRWLHRVARPPGDLLDIGCSAGFFLFEAKRSGWKVIGLELSEGTAKLAWERYKVEVRTQTIESAGLDENSFDAVTMWDVLEHVPDPTATLAEVHRLLRDDGVLALVTPNIAGLYPRLSLPLGRRLGYWPHPDLPEHLFQFSEAALAKLLAMAGFDVALCHHRRIPPFYKATRSARRLALALAFLPVSVTAPWLRRGDEILILARKTSERTRPSPA